MQYDLVDANDPARGENSQRLRSVRTTVVLWLVVFALALLIIPLLILFSWVRSDIDRLEANWELIQGEIISASLPTTEMTELEAEIERAQELVNSIASVNIPPGVYWPDVIAAINRYDRASITLLAITQTDTQLRLTGRAASNDAVVLYRESLFASGVFEDVIIQSMTFAPPAPPPVEDAADDDAPPPVFAPPRPVEFIMDLMVELPTP